MGGAGDHARQAASTALSAAAWRVRADMCGFAGMSGGGGRFAFGWRPLKLGFLLFGVLVEGVHDMVQALIYDLAVASHHRH